MRENNIMNAAQGLYELYKALPKKVQREIKKLIANDKEKSLLTHTIKKLGFTPQGKMWVELLDGRRIVTPLTPFPSIEKLSAQQRKAWQIIDGVMFSFVDCDEVYHVSQLLIKDE
ncbi:hypothetical protein DR864_09130 [Runella rosea]|uniref:Uncharacterized protein n=1 Tax=Runella rosea TaxID=2259595 RepID=A0A344TGW1_9BACT|nr:DUF2442 domain-containing protein [Runella rosea]AXE17882.1 hypothetical protein DR864_09130 [Runella rosea]